MKKGVKIALLVLILFVAMCHDRDRVSGIRSIPEFAATYLGGEGHEVCEAIALDSDGNIYVAGNTRSSDFPTTPDAYNRNPKGKSDVFIAKFDNGLKTLLASTIIGGDEDECAYTMLFDPSGFVYVAGYTSSNNFPTTDHAYDESYNGGEGDAFILMMDKDLKALVASTYLGGGGEENDWRSPELVRDGDGNIYIAGITGSEDFPTTTGAYQDKYNGGARDVFLSKLDSGLGELLASTLLGGSKDDRMGRSLFVDGKKNEICVGGYTFSPEFPTTQNAYGRVISGNLDGFVSKLSLDLKVLNASTILPSGWIYSLMIHENGDIYVGGHAAEGLPTSSNAFHPTFDKASDQGFISCLSNDLSELKSSTVIPGTFAAGGGQICSLNLCQSADGHVLSAGWARPLDFPITPGVYDETQNGRGDTYIMKMDKDLSKVLLSTFIGGSRSERWNRMTTDGRGRIYLAGYTLSSDFPTGQEAAFKEFSEVINDDEEDLNTSPRDAFIIKIDENLSAEARLESHEAAKRDHLSKLQELLSEDRSRLEKRDRYQRTPLHSAARYGALSAARFLLDQGADPNVEDESGNTPLHLASLFRHDEIIGLLVQHKADVSALNAQRQAALGLATIYGNPEGVKKLLAGGAETALRDADGNTPLHLAALYRRPENLAELLKANPDIDAVDADGHTPLHLSVLRPGNGMVIQSLLEHGVDRNLRDPKGRNALMASVDSNQMGYIKLLVSHGIDINSQDNDGNTALHYPLAKALSNKMFLPYCQEIVKVLLDEGADATIRNKEGKSPIDLAVETGESELISLLKPSEPAVN
jgi:ankyrin repeat protein